MDSEQPSKRRKVHATPASTIANHSSSEHVGLSRPISPPVSGRQDLPSPSCDSGPGTALTESTIESLRYIPLPIQLTKIGKLQPSYNIDTVDLEDILGDPMIKECWNFNYLFDLDFVMKHFDEDVRSLVKVKVIHGFWKGNDDRKIALLEAAKRYPNVEPISAYMPYPFGTHHCKMLILVRHDDLVQVIIHTANMVSQDWHNLTQAIWRSPLLPLSSPSVRTSSAVDEESPIGSGGRFKVDLLRYLKAYGSRLNSLTEQLINYDFSLIRAAFIGSVPSRQKLDAAKSYKCTSFGWLGLQDILSTVPSTAREQDVDILPPHIVIQVSSIATLGSLPTWLSHFQSVLCHHKPRGVAPHETAKYPTRSSLNTSSFLAPGETSELCRSTTTASPVFNIIFPTVNEIRNCLSGYRAGASIHMKLQSEPQKKQFEYMKQLFCHWSYPTGLSTYRKAFRDSVAPHIKTYVRFSDQAQKTIDWALLTSANLSKQAWGDVVDKKSEVWIQSYEVGVVVWPALFANEQDGTEAIIVPTFGKDLPEHETATTRKTAFSPAKDNSKEGKTVVGFRMPYNLPLVPYDHRGTTMVCDHGLL